MTVMQVAVGFDGNLIGIIPIGGLSTRAEDSGPISRPYMTAFLISDEEGFFGRLCPKCKQYFRVEYPPTPIAGCPYCPFEAPTLRFCTTNQLKFLEAFVNQTIDAPEGETIIDLDALADSLEANEQGWVYTEETQQHKVTCSDCKMTFDILGEYAACPKCRKRTTLVVFNRKLGMIEKDLEGLAAEPPAEPRNRRIEQLLSACVADFDGAMKDIAKQLSLLPLVPSRRQMVRDINFQWIEGMSATLNTCFGIDALSGFVDDDRSFAALMFNRRHLVIHNAGRVDQTYLDRTGDKSVRLHEQIVVTDDQLRRLVPIVRAIGRNIIIGFESIGPPAQTS